MGKFRVECRMEKPPLAGTSPAPKQGPQKQERMEAPAAMREEMAPFRVSSIITGWLAG